MGCVPVFRQTRMNLYLHISKDRPSIALEPSSPLPGRIAPSLRRSAATPPARSDLVVSHHLAGLLLVGPARAVAAAHDPGVHRPFHHQPKLADPRGACPALRSFPSADSRCRWTLRRHLAVRAVHAGRLSPPARLSPRLAVPLRVAAPWGPVVPSSCSFRCQTLAPPPGTLTHPGSSPAALPPRCSVDLGSCLPTSTASLAVFLHRRVRCATAVSDCRARCSLGLGLLVRACCDHEGRALALGGVSTSKIGSFEPASRLLTVGFRRCRGGLKQAPCQPRATGERRLFARPMGNGDPIANESLCMLITTDC